jgi:hypothetical protein
MSTPHTITSLPTAPEVERKSRMVKYSIAMGIRLVCIGACFIAPGWWLLLPAAGAVLLPYVAVVVANQVSKEGSGAQGYTPGALVRRNPDSR